MLATVTRAAVTLVTAGGVLNDTVAGEWSSSLLAAQIDVIAGAVWQVLKLFYATLSDLVSLPFVVYMTI